MDITPHPPTHTYKRGDDEGELAMGGQSLTIECEISKR